MGRLGRQGRGLRSFIKTFQQSPRLGRNDRPFIILAREYANRLQGREYHDGDELHLLNGSAQVPGPFPINTANLFLRAVLPP